MRVIVLTLLIAKETKEYRIDDPEEEKHSSLPSASVVFGAGTFEGYDGKRCA
jgi:hypothetical protein